MTVSQVPSLTSFSSGTTILSSPMNSNFSALRTAFNNLIVGDDKLMLGDTSNANLTVGITINQGANDDQILALKSSDVAHGLTTAPPGTVETDDFLAIFKADGALGGAVIDVLMEDAAQSRVFEIAVFGGEAEATKSTAARALIEMYASEHNGSGTLANITADGNVFGVRARVGGSDLMRWLVDEDGDTWQAGGMTITGALVPAADNTVNLGTGLLSWSAIHIASAGALSFANADVSIVHSSNLLTITGGGLSVSGDAELDCVLNHDGTTVGFYGATPVALQTGVAVSAAGIHAALVNLGLITA